jgi:hypothetical protein
MSAFPYTNKKFSLFTSDTAAHPERIAKISVATLIEGAVQSNPRLN